MPTTPLEWGALGLSLVICLYLARSFLTLSVALTSLKVWAEEQTKVVYSMRDADMRTINSVAGNNHDAIEKTRECVNANRDLIDEVFRLVKEIESSRRKSWIIRLFD